MSVWAVSPSRCWIYKEHLQHKPAPGVTLPKFVVLFFFPPLYFCSFWLFQGVFSPGHHRWSCSSTTIDFNQAAHRQNSPCGIVYSRHNSGVITTLNHLFHHTSFLSLEAKATKANLIIALNIHILLAGLVCIKYNTFWAAEVTVSISHFLLLAIQHKHEHWGRSTPAVILSDRDVLQTNTLWRFATFTSPQKQQWIDTHIVSSPSSLENPWPYWALNTVISLIPALPTCWNITENVVTHLQ